MFDRVHNSLHDSNPFIMLIDIDYNKRKCKGKRTWIVVRFWESNGLFKIFLGDPVVRSKARDGDPSSARTGRGETTHFD